MRIVEINKPRGILLDKWIGIDPGKQGGIGIIYDDNNKDLDVVPMDTPQSFAFFIEIEKPTIRHVFIEHAQAMPRQGVTSMFTYGEHFGHLQGILIAYKVPYTLVPPRNWQRAMFLGTKQKTGAKKRNPKDRALEAANRVFAKKSSFWFKSKRCKKPHDGMIDAALIAEFCRRSTK